MLLDKEFLEAVAENGKLRARIAELEAALKPFADAYWQDDVSDYVPIGGKLTVDDFRAACVTMEGIDD